MSEQLTIPANAWPFIHAAQADAHMTCRQMAILALVAAHPGLSNKPIAQTLDISPPVVTRAADWLIELGLLTRVQDLEDRRRVVLTVTPHGRRLLASLDY